MAEHSFKPSRITRDWLNSMILKNNNEENNNISNYDNYNQTEWELIEIWRKTLTSMNDLNDHEQEQRRLEENRFEQITALLNPLITHLQLILPSSLLHNLALIYSLLTPPSSSSQILNKPTLSNLLTLNPLPGLYQSYIAQESRIIYLKLEVEEGQLALKELERDLEKREKERLRSAAQNHAQQSSRSEEKINIMRSNKSIQMLELKRDEYRLRKVALQKQVATQFSSLSSTSTSSSTSSSSSPLPPSLGKDSSVLSLTTFSSQSQESQNLKSHHTILKIEFKDFSILPSNLEDARLLLQEKKARVMELKKKRDELLFNLGRGVN